MSAIRLTDQTAAQPVPLTSFVGREREIEAVAGLLQGAELRLLTLTGPGGVGKTRLALRVASEVAPSFRDGVSYVRLAEVHDPELVLVTVAQALDVPDGAGQPVIARLQTVLRDRHLLLVLDNLEHLLDAAASLVVDLLAGCPSLTVLGTSRVRLAVSGEQVFPVGALRPEDARRLFAVRARAVAPAFAVTADTVPIIDAICDRVDGLPLAIELAAARISVLPHRAVLARLEQRLDLLAAGPRDAPARQRDMRATIAWSYDLLTDREQALFRRLGVFVGGYSLAAAEAVTGDTRQVLPDLTALVAASLVNPAAGVGGEPRFTMLETIREFAIERLAESGEEWAIRAAHAAWCCRLVEQAEPALAGPDLIPWLDRLELDQPNLRAALAWSLTGDVPDPGWRMAAALGWFWWARGDPDEGRAWLEQALARSGDATVAMRARLQTRLAEILWSLGDYDRSVALDELALATWRALGDERGIAACLLNLGRIAQDTGHYARAAEHYEASLARYRALGDASNTMRCLANLGMVVMFEGNLERAATLQEESLGLAREAGLQVQAAKTAYNLAEVHRRRGDLARAAGLFRESLVRHRELGERRFIAEALRGLALVAAALGKAEAAARLAWADETVRGEIGARITPEPERLEYERVLAGMRARLGPSAWAEMQSAGKGADATSAVADATEIAERLVQRAASSAGPRPVAAGLSARELDVLRLLVEGRSDKEIGTALFLSHRTVMHHVSAILTKLGVENRTAATHYAIRHGLV